MQSEVESVVVLRQEVMLTQTNGGWLCWCGQRCLELFAIFMSKSNPNFGSLSWVWSMFHVLYI